MIVWHCQGGCGGGAERDVPVVRGGCDDFPRSDPPSAVCDVDLSFARVVLGGSACQSCTHACNQLSKLSNYCVMACLCTILK